MTGFLISGAVIVFAVVSIWLAVRVADGDRPSLYALLVLVFLGLGFLFNAMIEGSKQGPCHKYETRMMYNAVTKTMMPYRVCVLRGEWVEEAER